jgi:hypothetical protein
MPKSLSKTPAPKKDRIFGSDKNKVGSASSKASAKGIELSESILATLSQKAKDYNESHPNSKVSVATLKAVMRRGMGAYSTSHRPTISGGAPNSRQAWGFARVNKFLKKKAGQQVKAAYVQDDDLMADGGETKKSKEAYTIVGVYKSTNDLGREESEDLTKEGLLGYRVRYNKMPMQYYAYVGYENTESDLERAKSDVARYNKEVEDEKQRKKLKDVENKIKREKQKIIDAQKLEAAKTDDTPKPAYLMTNSEYQDRVVPLLKEYEKFARKNSEYLSDTTYSGFYKVTFEQVLSRGLDGKKTGYYFRSNDEKQLIENWNERKFRKYDDFTIPAPTPTDILEKNIAFFKDLNKFFDEKVIFDGLTSEYKKSNKSEIRRAIEDDTYKKMIENGEITEDEVIKIAEEQGVKVPKKVFSQESLLKKEAKKQMNEILSKIPQMNKDVFESLLKQLSEDFKDVEKIIIEQETERFEGLIEDYIKLSEKEGGVNVEKLKTAIPFWGDFFDKYEEIVIRGKDYRGYPNIERFFKNLKLQSDYKRNLDKIVLNYAESLKYRFLKAVLDNFPLVSKPISDVTRESLKVGKKGFEGRYRFNFADGSYFDFVTEAIPAAGYNIVSFHYRYITHLENATLADGTKIKGYYEIMQKFSSDSMADGGSVGQEITCVNCGWHWNTSDSDESDKYICHKCGFDNRTFYDPEPIGEYHLGGDMSKHLAPNGKPSNLNHEQWHLVRTPEFKAWFGDWENDYENASKVVDENGEPLVVYHGSNKNFNIFQNSEQGTFGAGIYFTSDKILANLFSDKNNISSKIYEVFLNVRKPYIFSKEDEFYEVFLEDKNLWSHLKSDIYATKNLLQNYDGSFWKKEYVVYYPTQIKLADGSNTTFDSNNPDIRYENGGVIAFNKKMQGKEYLPYFKEEYSTTEEINKTIAAYYLQEIAKKYVGWVNEIEFANESKNPRNHFQLRMYLEDKILWTAPFIYVDDNHKVVAKDTKIELLDRNYETIKSNLKYEDGGEIYNPKNIQVGDYVEYQKWYYNWVYTIKGKVIEIVESEFYLPNSNYKQAKAKILIESKFGQRGALPHQKTTTIDISKLQRLTKDGSNDYSSLTQMEHGGSLGIPSQHDLIKMELGLELFKPSKTIEQIAKEKDVPLDYAEEQLRKGMKTESEHSDNPIVQETIALQHLDEMIDYYEKLEYMESQNKMANGDLLDNSMFNKALIYKSIKPIRQANEIIERLDYMEIQNKMEKGGVTEFYKEYQDWYKGGVSDKMTIMVSVPNAFSKMSSEDNHVILDLFEKRDESVDGKEKLKELLELADKNEIDVYLEPIPRHNKIKDEAKKEKITREYLISYYEKFGFELLPNGFMVRKHKNNKMEKGGQIPDEIKENPIYKILLEKSKEDSFTKVKVRMPSLDKINLFLRDIGIDVATPRQSKDFLKAGQFYTLIYGYEGQEPLRRAAYHIDISRGDGYYSRNTPYYAKEILKYIDNFYKENQMEKGGYYKAGGEINPDDKNVKDYFSHGSGNVGGVLVGKRHSEGGIKAVNKSTNQPLEMEGGEVVITRNAVSDNEKREFEGKMMTNREILSKINESGGGVSFADGGDIPESIYTSGKEYKYGGKTMKDHEIVSSCGCKHSMAKGGITGDLHSLTNQLLAQKIEIFIKKVQPIKFYYIDEDSNSLIIGLDENYTTGMAEKLYKEATSSAEFFDADSVNMEYNQNTGHAQYSIKLKKVAKFGKGGEMAEGGETENIKYNSYQDFVNDNIGSKKIVVRIGSGGQSQPISGATKEFIEEQFKKLIYHEFMDSNFYYNYASNDIKEEYKSFIIEFYNSLIESPKKFSSFWENNMTKSMVYNSLYEIKDKYKNIEDNYNYSTGDKRIDTKSKYVLAIKNSIGQTIKYEPIEKPENYESYIFSEYKNKMSEKLKKEYIDYRKKYAGEDIKLREGGETDYQTELKNHLFPKVEVEVEVEVEPEMDLMPDNEHYITADDLGLSDGMPMLAVGTIVYSSGGNDQWEVVSFSDDGVNLVNKPKSPLQSKMEDKHLTFEELIKYFKDKAISIKNISTERELEPAIALVKNKIPQKSYAMGGFIDGDEDEDAKIMQSQFGKSNFK